MNSNAKRGLAGMVALALSQAVNAMIVNTAARSGVNSAVPAANVVNGPLNWDEKSDLKGFSLAFLSGRSTGR
ncbi:hypothetical protein SMZ82_002229 [Cronobacter malonaticus]|nr:hypothetical protein [Cronobacter malonaticus]EGT4383560.1 hypothetical protein [Cronobacter malonaticus]EGT4421551.1 hypothetical protein [Cronobacter malonaticus]EGT4446380.1 hypothetical protein [Cronobacter malonaticus]EGT4453894.1 hypothetical protein [Cronobacter malonaticus]EKP4389219.1 hypothetical protein [Cronobacter malonaticus]